MREDPVQTLYLAEAVVQCDREVIWVVTHVKGDRLPARRPW
jgi:hypothetical protein